MTTFPGSPRVLRGALVTVDPATSDSVVIPFQYNPATVSRSYQISAATAGAEAGQHSGPPAETIQIELILDATDAMQKSSGPKLVSARIAALLGLVSPTAEHVQDNLALAAQGAIEILAPSAPLLLFVYGRSRVQPVAITELSVTEEAHDATLAPIRARVSVGMQVLRYSDIPSTQTAHALSLANQVALESQARNVGQDDIAAAIVRGALDAL